MVLEADLVKALNLKTIIAAENGRSANKEIELMIKQRIELYEKECGTIDLSE